MTIMEAINRIDAIKPNRYSQDEKVHWLSTLDGIIKAKIIDTHDGSEKIAFDGYTEKTSLAKQLLVPAPYDEIYLFWLESKIDYWNGEMGRYNNSISMYNTTYEEYARYYHHTHRPKSKKINFF